jgi:hypothetical protein
MTESAPHARGQTSGAPALRAVLGARVEIELLDERGQTEQLAFDIVPDEAADFANGFLGVGTPLAQVLLGNPAGSTLPYRMADIQEVRIISIAPSRRAPAGDAAARRQAASEEAVSKANLDDAVRLALTVDVKWGDYDPEGLADNW